MNSDPFELLEVAESADDEAIKKAYLEQVRRSPPDHDPVRFQAVREAFEAIKTGKDRLAHELFHHQTPDIDTVWRELVGDRPAKRPDEATLRKALGEAVKQISASVITQSNNDG